MKTKMIGMMVFSVLMLNLSVAFANSSPEYLCQPGKNNSNTDAFVIQISGEKLSMTIKGETETHSLKFDSSYSPRLNKGYNRYKPVGGDDDFLTGGESYDIDVLVSQSIEDEEGKGAMKIIARGEGFFNDYFSCVQQ